MIQRDRRQIYLVESISSLPPSAKPYTVRSLVAMITESDDETRGSLSAEFVGDSDFLSTPKIPLRKRKIRELRSIEPTSGFDLSTSRRLSHQLKGSESEDEFSIGDEGRLVEALNEPVKMSTDSKMRRAKTRAMMFLIRR